MLRNLKKYLTKTNRNDKLKKSQNRLK